MDEMRRIIGAGILKGIRSTADGGIDFTIASNPQKDYNFELHLKPVTFLIQEGKEAPSNFDAISSAMEKSGVESEMPIGKTPSQRLRNTLYVLWEQSSQAESSKDFYNNKIEEIINHFKSKLI